MWQIAPEIRAMVKFMPFNLLGDFAPLGRFDVVLCRNVLIYFDQATKVGVLERIADVTERDGFLMLGGAETVVGLTDRFKPVADKRGLYAHPDGPAGDVLEIQRAAGARCRGWCRRLTRCLTASARSFPSRCAPRSSRARGAPPRSAAAPAIAGLTLPLPSKSTARAIASRRGSSMWS